MELTESSSFDLTLQPASSACEPYTNHVIEQLHVTQFLGHTRPTIGHVFISVISDVVATQLRSTIKRSELFDDSAERVSGKLIER